MEQRDSITNSLRRAFYLMKLAMVFPSHARRTLVEAYGEKVGCRLYDELNYRDVPGWFARLGPKHRFIFLNHAAFKGEL